MIDGDTLLSYFGMVILAIGDTLISAIVSPSISATVRSCWHRASFLLLQRLDAAILVSMPLISMQ